MTFDSGEPKRGARVGLLVPACLVVSGLLAAFLWTADVTGVLGVPAGASLALLALTSALVAARALGFLPIIRLDTLVGAHLAVAFALTTVLVHFTGGAKSPFGPLYVPIVFAAGLYRETRGALLFAVAGTLALTLLRGGGGASAILALAANAGCLFAIGALAGHAGSASRRQEARLEEVSTELDRVLASTERVIESVPVGILTATVDGRITRINHAAAAILGIEDPLGLVGYDLREYLGGLAPALVDAFEFAAVTGKWSVREEVMLGEGNAARPVGISMTPIPGDPGAGAEGVVVAITDLRELRRMEREMRRSEQLATLGEIAAGVAHEIRNPLASISGAIQVLRDDAPASGDQAELMDLIVKESERLNRIINGFLDYTRDHSLSKALYDVSLIVHEVVRLLSHDRTVSIGKTFLVEFPKDQDFRAMIEEEGIKQVFFNLARNALEAMQLGGILRITGENSGDGRLYIVFRDTGEGIAPHELEQVFKPFHTSKSGGTGLGLSIATRIMEGHGGAIRIKSTPGVGTAVTVELPAAIEPFEAIDLSSFEKDSMPKREENPPVLAASDAWPTNLPS